MIEKIAIVTGANKGLGFGIVKELCKRQVKTVFLTARDVEAGINALNSLKNIGLNPLFYQLDITDEESVKRFADHIRSHHKGIDILVNNAAIISKNITEISLEDAKHVINNNFESILSIEQFLFPLLNDNARVINICSDTGHLSKLKNKYWLNKLSREDLTLKDIQDFINWFLDSIQNNNFNPEDFAWKLYLPYVVSKMALCAYTRIQQRNIGRNISINSLHPGFVKTPMTKGTGMLTIDQASDAPVYLALDADDTIKGKFIWFDKSEKEWTDTNLTLDYVDPKALEEFVENMKV